MQHLHVRKGESMQALRGLRPQYDIKWLYQELGRSDIFAREHKRSHKTENVESFAKVYRKSDQLIVE